MTKTIGRAVRDAGHADENQAFWIYSLNFLHAIVSFFNRILTIARFEDFFL
jgi:hypothetical protein